MTKGSHGQRASVPSLALPSDLSGSLRRLDDDQFGRLVRAVAEEARRRGHAQAEASLSSASGPAKSKRPASNAGGAKTRAMPLTPGQEKLVRAAFEAGVKPADIARQLRLSRAQVEKIVGRPKRGGG